MLAAITLNKLGRQLEVHRAAKRDIAAEVHFNTGDSSLRAVNPQVLAADPKPADAVAMVEEVELLMRDFTADQRRMLEMRLSGYKLEEIAEEMQRSERTVRRLLEKVKQRLERRLAEFTAA